MRQKINNKKEKFKMTGLILVVIVIAVFFWYKKKKQNNASTQNNIYTQSNISAQTNTVKQEVSFAPFKSADEKQYYEMAYGLLSSSVKERSLDDIRRFVEFHTSRVEVFDYKNPISPSDAAKKFLKEGIGYSRSLFKNNEELTNVLTAKGVSAVQIEKIIKLNESLDESLAYRYLSEDADKICDSKNYEYNGFGTSRTVVCKIPKGYVISLIELFSDETVRQYCAIVGALSEVLNTKSIDFNEAKKYIELQTKQSCDSQKLKCVLEFAQGERTRAKFGITTEDINKYKSPIQEEYQRLEEERKREEKAATTLTNDEVAKQYYTIVCGLLDSINPNGATFDNVKQHIECHIKQSCDAEKINFVLTFFIYNGKYYFINNKYYKLIGISIADINKYKLSKEEVYRMCYPEIFESIKSECKELFSTATSYGIEHFDTGWVRRDRESNYANKIGVEERNHLYRQVVQELFFEGEESVVKTLCNRFDCYSATARNYYWARYGGVTSVQKAMPIVAEHAGAVAVRALHFEKYGHNRKEYNPLTEDECREMISNSESFKRVVGQIMGIDPFRYKEWSNGVVKSKFDIFDWIQKEAKVESYYSSKCEYLPFDAECYYADALCHAFWKYVEKRYQNVNSMDFDTIFEIMLDYFTPGEKVIDELVNRDDRREALHKQCQSCALYDSCNSRRENCPSWIPKS